jgi:glycosyltransferase involved in cell wall biosynthesis
MKILFIMASTGYGGAEEYMLTIARAAVKSNVSVHAAFPITPEKKSLLTDLTRNKILCSSLPIGNDSFFNKYFIPFPLKCFHQFILVWYACRKIKPDKVFFVLCGVSDGPGVFTYCAAVNLPLCCVFQLWPEKTPRMSAVQKGLYKWAHGRRQNWICVSETNRKEITKALDLPPDRLKVIHNGIEIESYRISDHHRRIECKKSIRARSGIKESTRIFFTVGRLHEQKGHTFIIRALPGVVASFQDIVCVWAGQGPLESNLRTLADQENVSRYILFLGHRTDIRDLMYASDYFLFPTMFEGFSFALLEAMACRLPIIAGNTGSVAEMLDSSSGGLLFETGNSNDIAEKMTYALRNTDDMKRRSDYAYERVLTFNQRQMIDRILTEITSGLKT